jgi:hypothetical protein
MRLFSGIKTSILLGAAGVFACGGNELTTRGSVEAGEGGDERSPASDSGGSPTDGGLSEDSAAAALCIRTGGSVVETYCSARPPFTFYACTSDLPCTAVCDPGPGDTTPMTQECMCSDLNGSGDRLCDRCFDPVKGCVSAARDS